jgi:hypothetical protein
MMPIVIMTQRSIRQRAPEPSVAFERGPFQPIINHHYQSNKNRKIGKSQGQYYNPWEVPRFNEIREKGNNNRPRTRRTPLGAQLTNIMNNISGVRRWKERKTVP